MPATKWLLEAATIRPLAGRRTDSLRLLRALLRECTYLPDPAARVYMKEHIISRYRAYQPQCAPSGDIIRPLLQERFTRLHKTARKALSQLKKANAGHVDQLTKVLYMTYGRIGKRRYELLASLKRPEGPDGTESRDLITRKLEKLNIHSATIAGAPKFSDQLYALLRSQLAARPPNETRSKLKSLNIDLPEKNSWERPMPQKRVANIVKEWYGLVLHKVLPPLPEDEWERLGRLASGEQRWQGHRKRRPLGLEAMYSSSEAQIARFSTELQQELKIVHNQKSQVTAEPHNLSPRFMRRLWLNVFKMCPTMDWDSEKRLWKIRWGKDHPGGNSMNTRGPRNAGLLEVLEHTTTKKIAE